MTRPTGGSVAAQSNPWYRRVLHPTTVDEEYPPMPFVSSHSCSRCGCSCPFVAISYNGMAGECNRGARVRTATRGASFVHCPIRAQVAQRRCNFALHVE